MGIYNSIFCMNNEYNYNTSIVTLYDIISSDFGSLIFMDENVRKSSSSSSIWLVNWDFFMLFGRKCWKNYSYSLNVYKLPYLTDEHLKQYSIGIKKFTFIWNKGRFYQSERFKYQDPQITDDGISSLTNLTTLNLIGNYKITNNSLKCLSQLRKLYMKDNTIITSEGIENLINLTKLEICGISSIKDEGLLN